MNQLALVANHRSAWPSRAEIEALGVTGIRTIVYDNGEFEQALKDIPDHVRVVAMLNNENTLVKSDWSGWKEAVRDFSHRFAGRVEALECGNELDLWGLAPEFGAKLAREADDILPSSIKTLLSSVAGPNWVEWLRKAADLAHLDIDGVCLHPYGKRPYNFRDESWGNGWLREAIETAYEASGEFPVYLTEWGVKLGEAGGETGQAEYLSKGIKTVRSFHEDVVPFAAYFAWADAIGSPGERGENAFGLRDERLTHRQAWMTYARESVAGVTTPVVTVPTTPPTVPTITVKSVYTLDDVRQIRWQAIVPDAAYHSDFGFETYWRDHPELGSPLTAGELTLDTGEPCRPFANGILVWDGESVKVVG